MSEYAINAETRTVVGKKVKRLRQAGMVPATIYGPKHGPLSVQFPYRDIEVALRKAGGTNIINITVDGQMIPTLAREVQRHIIKGDILHVDFFAVDMEVKIQADIPLVLEGQSPIVVNRKGILMTGTNTVTVEMLPNKLMNQVVVDLAQLDTVGATIKVADLPLDPDITVMNDPEEMVATIVQPSAARAEQTLEQAAAAALGEGAAAGEGEAEAEEM